MDAYGVPVETQRMRAWFGCALSEFVTATTDSVLGKLAARSEFNLEGTQLDAWLAQIALLQTVARGHTGWVFLEYSIPRLGRRIDAVLLIGPVVFVLEFKVGERNFDSAAMEQVWDYALDLKNFHEASHAAVIIPIVVATEATARPLELRADEDGVFCPLCTNAENLGHAIAVGLQLVEGSPINGDTWRAAPYRPTPTIIEAARALYGRHTVQDICRSDAGAQNLAVTSQRVEAIAEAARHGGRKSICFVTGVPGAGKTLIGLNLATRHRDAQEKTHAVFLSGNGPLVNVLREALTRDELARRLAAGETARKGKVGESVKAFIQNVHHFRDEALVDSRPPFEHVVIFDEAQRAWNLAQTASFMHRKRKLSGFSQSEPEFLISYMDRHPDWAVVVCLVGGGQEINTGEAGISAWIEAARRRFGHWDLHISSRLADSEYAAGGALTGLGALSNVVFDDALHLAVSMRSFRAENVSAFVKALLDLDREQAHAHLAAIRHRYPLVITRELERAKAWVRSHARGSERFGLLASSKAQRLKPHAIDVRVEINPVHWFLNDRSDTRSSYYLEDAATEFQVQGLELDWSCVTWDGDLRRTEGGWSYHDFVGDRWVNLHKTERRQYLLNAYRVLLTRARQGMVIFVPRGDSADPTRSPTLYDATYRYLSDLGIPELA